MDQLGANQFSQVNSPRPAKRRGIGLKLRTALWSWVVTLGTLLTFAVAIIPQQKRTFQENLASKARSIAVSLQDVAAGSVVNEDFSSVVDHCKEMLDGDPAIDYLVITKNDGFSLVNERSGWRAQNGAGPEWRPSLRTASSAIGVVPLFNRRVFHYSQPFDYSGIEWGWIHVGLSLQSYDRSVAYIYRRTCILAIGCILLGLAASGFYAARLVKPILTLHSVVQRVAGGELTVRAQIHRGDELGILAASINTMTEALLRRDHILESVRFAAQQFLGNSGWNSVIEPIIAKIGQAADVSRAFVFENAPNPSTPALALERCRWSAPTACSTAVHPGVGTDLHYEGLQRWVKTLDAGRILAGLAAEFPDRERRVLDQQGIRSLILIPIQVEGTWWGFLRLEDCLRERLWTDSERDSLRAAADMLGAAIARQRTQDALVEAKQTLEKRVRERTQELQEQVLAKDRAHVELAQAQQQLMEASRQAGMAEVATGVLHNVGNVLNSVNVSVILIQDRLRGSQIPTLARVSSLFQQHGADLGSFLTSDPKGRRLPELLGYLGVALEEERQRLTQEVHELLKNVEHIKEVVAMQQSYARVAGVTENLSISSLVEDALQMNQGGFLRLGIVVKREFEEVSLVRVDKHKVLQILVNLFRNAKHALEMSNNGERVLILAINKKGDSKVRVSVRDNGVGIAPEDLTRVFRHGFTTKKDGHGFGLHSGALAAKEMGGCLEAQSEGRGKGATFILELPVAGNNATTKNPTQQ